MKQYLKMKQSNVDWIGTIPEKWNLKRLKFSAKLNSKKTNGEFNTLPYVGLENIESETGKLIDVNYEMEESDAKKFNKNSVLFGKLRPYLAKVLFTDFEGRCSSEFLVLEGKDYDPKFLAYLLISDGCIKIVNSSTYGAKMPRAEWSFIGNMLMPILNLDDQKKIAKYLCFKTTEIEFEIYRNQKLIKLLKEKLQGVINHAVTKGLDPSVTLKDSGIEWIREIPEHWKITQIKYLVHKIMKGIFDLNPDNYIREGIPFLRISDIQKNSINLMNTVHIKNEISIMNKNSELEPDDIVLSKVIVQNIEDKIAMIPSSIKKCNLNQNLVGIKIDKKKSFSKYLLNCLTNKEIISRIISQGNATTMAMIRLEFLRELIIPYPSITEQKQISEFLDEETSKIDFLISKTESQIQKLQEYRQSLISAAVTGKIDVRQEVVA